MAPPSASATAAGGSGAGTTKEQRLEAAVGVLTLAAARDPLAPYRDQEAEQVRLHTTFDWTQNHSSL